MKRAAALIALVELTTFPAHTEERWILTSNTVYLQGAKFAINSTHTSLAACEKERTKILDYVQEMQPQLVPQLGMACVNETKKSH